MNTKTIAVFVVFSLFGLTGPALASVQIYEVVDLGTLGGDASRAQGINNSIMVKSWGGRTSPAARAMRSSTAAAR
jgi:hypothetical protein